MRAEELAEISKQNSDSRNNLNDLLKRMRKEAEYGRYKYIAARDECNDACVNELRELGYDVCIDYALVEITWY